MENIAASQKGIQQRRTATALVKATAPASRVAGTAGREPKPNLSNPFSSPSRINRQGHGKKSTAFLPGRCTASIAESAGEGGNRQGNLLAVVRHAVWQYAAVWREE